MENGIHTMATTLKLYTNDCCLQIERISDKWYECKFLSGESSVRLGAETPNYIKQHLLSGLTEGPKTWAGQLEGREVYWVLSLAENHHVLYAAIENTGIVLYWQDAVVEPVRIIAKMHLSTEVCMEWRRQLEQL
jgi:hypothetical protein